MAMGPEIGILAEMASLQLEYTYLAKVTKKKQWFDRASLLFYRVIVNLNWLYQADTIIKILSTANLSSTGGMLPIRWNLTLDEPHDCRRLCAPQPENYSDSTYRSSLSGRASRQYTRISSQTVPLDRQNG